MYLLETGIGSNRRYWLGAWTNSRDDLPILDGSSRVRVRENEESRNECATCVVQRHVHWLDDFHHRGAGDDGRAI